MRNTVYPSQKADFLVSELLGSFGDNELSPECLDGAQRFMKSSDPFNRKILSIPSNYTAFLAPIASEKLKSEVINLNMRHVGKGNGSKKVRIYY